FDKSGVWTKFWCSCDYCEVGFLRTKRNILVGRKIIDKESCNSSICKRAKMEESQSKKYGVKNYASTEECKNKIKATSIDKYQTDNPSKNVEVKRKARMTCQERYGVDAYLLTED